MKKNKSKNNTKTAAFKGGTEWLKFYRSVRFPICFILNTIIMIIYTATNVQYLFAVKYVTSLIIVTLVGLSPTIFLFTFDILVYIRMKKMELSAYNLNIVLITAETLIISLVIFIIDIFYGLLSLILIGLIWWLPNFIYFRKRKFLFTDPAYKKEKKKKAVIA
jgi:hypothetical protein